MDDNVTKNHSFWERSLNVSALYLAVSTVFAQIMAWNYYLILSLAAMFMWFACAVIYRSEFFKRLKMYELSILFFVFYTTVVPYLCGNGVVGNRYLAFSLVLSFHFIYTYNRQCGDNNSNKSIVKWTLPFILYTAVMTTIALIDNSWAARLIKTKGEESMLARAQGIGGYEFIYFIVFLCILLWFIILNRKLLKLKLQIVSSTVVLLALLLYTILLSQYFTAIIMLLVGSSIVLMYTRRHLLFNVTLAMAGVLLILNYHLLLPVAINLMTNLGVEGKTIQRLESLQDGLSLGDDSIVSGRTPTLSLSWNAIMENPMIGIVAQTTTVASDGSLDGFGQHSQFLDTFALYGVFIGFLMVYIVARPFFARKFIPVLTGLNVAMLIMSLVLFSINNVTPSVGFAVFFIYPVLCDWVESRIVPNAER